MTMASLMKVLPLPGMAQQTVSAILLVQTGWRRATKAHEASRLFLAAREM